MSELYKAIPLSSTSPGASVEIPVNDLPQTFGFNGSGQLTTITLVYKSITFVQTFTYSGSNISNITGWVEQ